jgi:hypothetical protein
MTVGYYRRSEQVSAALEANRRRVLGRGMAYVEVGEGDPIVASTGRAPPAKEARETPGIAFGDPSGSLRLHPRTFTIS